MITEKEYLEAKMIIELYESQQLNIPYVSKSASWENLLKQTGGKRPKGIVKGYMRH